MQLNAIIDIYMPCAYLQAFIKYTCLRACMQIPLLEMKDPAALRGYAVVITVGVYVIDV